MDLDAGDATTPTDGTRTDFLRRSLTVGQIPHDPSSGRSTSAPSWLGLDGVTPSGGELAMASLFVTEASGGSGPIPTPPNAPPMTGLFVDSWVEKVPQKETDLGVAFQYDDPDARPPQSVILAVPPSWSTGTDGTGLQPTDPLFWSMETVRTTLEETVDLVAARSVDIDALDSLGHLLPATCFATNVPTDGVSTSPELLVPDAPSVVLDAVPWTELE